MGKPGHRGRGEVRRGGENRDFGGGGLTHRKNGAGEGLSDGCTAARETLVLTGQIDWSIS
jgi:hypothetical protein